MIVETEDRHVFATTERAKVWIKHILNVPFPEQKWIVPPDSNVGIFGKEG
jgi:hypothetical protein